VLQQTHSVRSHAKFRLDRFILSPSGGEKPQFLSYFGLRHSVMSPVGSNLRKLSTGAQLQSFLYPMVSKSFLYSDAFMTKSGAQSLTFKGVKDRDRQTKNSTILAAPLAGEIRAPPTWHGDRGPQAHSCTSKAFGGLTHIVSLLRSVENLGITRPRQLKTLITP